MIFKIIVFFSSFLITYMLSNFFAKNIPNFNFYSIFARERSLFHKDSKEILKVGGIIIFISVSLALFIPILFKETSNIDFYNLKKIAGLTTGAIIMLILGIFDDAKKVSYKGKFLWQIIAIVPLIISGYKISWLSFFGNSFPFSLLFS